MNPGPAFLICTERGPLEGLSILFVRSLRRYGGSLSYAPVYSFAPREGRGVAAATRQELTSLGVVHSEEVLNASHPDYPLANKVRVCAHAERTLDHALLVFADSDQVVWNEPAALCLAPDEDAAAQPEPVARIGAGKPGDDNYEHWTALLARHGIDEPRFTRTAVGGKRIFGYWNSGLIAVRRRAGIFQCWEEIFDANWNEDIWPKDGDHRYYLEQVSFGLALMARKARLRTLPRDYNYHAVIHGDLPAADRRSDFADMTTMHYHKLLSKSSWRDPTRRVRDFDPRGERYEWLRQQMRELGIGRPGGLRGLAARLVRKLRKLSGAAAPG